MKMSMKQFRVAVREAAKVGASASYMKKERIRERLQDVLSTMISSDIKSQAELDELFVNVGLALNALKMIPLEVWSKLQKKR
jgi:hypothetical protein